jgi:hypothetical protein
MKVESKLRGIVRLFLWMAAVTFVSSIPRPAPAVDRIAVSPQADNELICDTDGKCDASLCEDGTTACTTGDDCKLFYCVDGSNDGNVCNPNAVLATECPGGTACISPACLRVHNEDVVVCRPDSTGELTSSCDWSLLFDGTDAGLAPKVGDPESSNERVKSFEFLDDGSVVIQFATTVNGLGGVGTVRDKDLARCRPVREDNPGVADPYNFPITECAWSLFLNGEGVKAASDARAWDSVAVLQGEGNCRDVDGDLQILPEECDVLLSLPGGDDLGGVPVFDEDILRCRPTSLSGIAPGKTIESCEYAKFLDASQINGAGGSGSWTGETFAFDVAGFDQETFQGLLYARLSNQATNPPHQTERDIMELDGTFGPTGVCSVSLDSCIADSDCVGTCNSITTDPSGTMTLFLDGDGPGVDPQAGLGTAAVDAVAIIEDGDDDDVPDGADNCPDHVNPPEICTDGVTVCTPGGGECPGAHSCVQKDTDDDGTGDACDICNGRPDTGPMACMCGDGILDVPTQEAEDNGLTNEECDLNGLNGMPDAPCTIGCQTSGHCTGDPDMSCFEQADCTGFGDCCGDGQVLGSEECDDANGIDDDECANDCTENDIGIGEGIPILGACADIIGPNIVPAFVKLTKFNDRGKLGDSGNAGDIDKWKTRGDFNLIEGVTIDPDTEPVTITYNNNTVGIIFEHTLPSGNFTHKVEKPTRNVWLFKDKEANVADSWRKGKFTDKKNKEKFTLDGRTESMPDPDLFEVADIGSPVVMRQSIRVGDVCATAIVNCEVKGGGKSLKCDSGP